MELKLKTRVSNKQEANLMKRLELCDGVQSWVSRVKRRGLSTHPWGAPVFSVMVLDVLMPTRTAWGLPVRKSNSQLHREVLSPSWTIYMLTNEAFVLIRPNVLNKRLEKDRAVYHRQYSGVQGFSLLTHTHTHTQTHSGAHYMYYANKLKRVRIIIHLHYVDGQICTKQQPNPESAFIQPERAVISGDLILTTFSLVLNHQINMQRLNIDCESTDCWTRKQKCYVV